jgi:hypothetical protein
MNAVESRVGWRSFRGVRDRREAAATRSDGQVVREIGTAQTLLTPAQVEELVERHRGGEGVMALATAYGVQGFTLDEIAGEPGTSQRPQPWRRLIRVAWPPKCVRSCRGE